ncbi:lactose permease [Fusarium beomiforme]|uniref:Lactose permease n=1 Tax=Fusarium beomiforme TaxID=44412 RepID=A0A9P5A5U2_9HYPO|nr:lactose permease [Fusarium beomiforme]
MSSEKPEVYSLEHEEHPHIDVPHVTWYKHAGLCSLYIRMPLLMLCATISGMNRTLLEKMQSYQDTHQDTTEVYSMTYKPSKTSELVYFGHPSGSTLGLYTAIVNIGAFTALFFSVPSVNESLFIGDRFLVGFGSNISIGVGPLLIMELAYPQHRGRLNVMYNTLWYVGSIIAAWTVFGTIEYNREASWRVPVVFQALMPMVQLLGVFILPESPHWLCSKGRNEEALNILIKSLFNGGLQISSFLVAIGFSVYFVEKLGRRMLFLIAAIGMLVVFSVWIGCSTVYADTSNSGAGKAVFAMIFLFYGVTGFAWPGLTVAYCSDILPYSIRAKGLTICLGVTALSGVLNQYVNPIGLDKLTGKFYFVYIVILFIEVACIWYPFVENKGPTLEEIAVLIDGKDAKSPKKVTMDKNQDTLDQKVGVKDYNKPLHSLLKLYLI